MGRRRKLLRPEIPDPRAEARIGHDQFLELRREHVDSFDRV